VSFSNVETPEGICTECIYKLDEKLAANGRLVIQAENKRGTKAQRKALAEAQHKMTQRAKELSSYAERLADSGAFWGSGSCDYAIIDDRSSTPAAAAPIVLGR
jgi:hypothetical protein